MTAYIVIHRNALYFFPLKYKFKYVLNKVPCCCCLHSAHIQWHSWSIKKDFSILETGMMLMSRWHWQAAIPELEAKPNKIQTYSD